MLTAPYGGPGFTFAVDTFTGAPSAATSGTVQISGPGTANVDGTEVQLFSALARDVCYVVIAASDAFVSGGNNGALLDLMIDPAGGTSWSSFVDDLLIGSTPNLTAGTIGHETVYHLPLWIPAGASLAVRMRHRASGTPDARVGAWLYGEPAHPQLWWCGQRVESLGINAGTSQGTSHTPGTTGAYSSWATIGTSTRRYGALQMGIQYPAATLAAQGYYWQMGVGGEKLPGSPTIFAAASTTEALGKNGLCQPIWCDLPSGTAIQTRGVSSLASSPTALDVAFYGVY